ncbi:MAG: molybdopterin-guanine dinucleotide biosynthesis protein B [Myxococcota bacterium]
MFAPGLQNPSGAGAPVIGLVGPSGVGKTTLLECTVATLRAWAVDVGVVKHSSRAVQVDRPGKDSDRLYRAGAAAVALAMPGQIATFVRRDPTRPSLSEALAALPADLDLVLVEGFAWEPIPRWVLLPPDGSDLRGDLALDRAEILGVLRAPERPEGRRPHFEPTTVETLARMLLRQAGLALPIEVSGLSLSRDQSAAGSA